MGKSCGPRAAKLGALSPAKVSFGKVIVKAARSFAGTRRVLLKATPRQWCLPEGALLLHSRTKNVRARDSDQRQSQHLQRALSVANLTTEELSMQDFTLQCVFALGLLNGDVLGPKNDVGSRTNNARQAKCVTRFSHEPHFVAVDLDFPFQDVGSRKFTNKQVCRSVIEFLRASQPVGLRPSSTAIRSDVVLASSWSWVTKIVVRPN